MNLTTEQIGHLAQLERRMDSGEQPFVLLNEERIAVHVDVMTELGLDQGQTISQPIFVAILQAQLAHCQAQLEMKKLERSQNDDHSATENRP